MANVAHSTLTGSNLHETKGMASATDDYVLTATSGAGVYKKLTAINLTGTGNPFGAQLFHVRDQRTSGTAGQTFSGSTWNTKVLQTSVTNEITSASLSSNQISLPSGTYFADGWSTYYGPIGLSALRLRNITGSADLLNGGIGYSYISSANGTYLNSLTTYFPILIKGRFTLSGTTTIELQQYGGGPSPAASLSSPEVYADLLIWKIA